MKFDELLSIVGDEALFETGLLLAGQSSPGYLRRQLSGWVADGRLWQVRRGLYALAPPYQRTAPHPFYVANRLARGSYVSLQAALGYYGLIPEYVPVVTSVTGSRSGEWDTPLGRFVYHHVQPDLFTGYSQQPVTDRQAAHIATPEKALLDLVYLTPGGDDPGYLESLRLQNLDQIDGERLIALADSSGQPKLRRAVTVIERLAAEEAERYRTL